MQLLQKLYLNQRTESKERSYLPITHLSSNDVKIVQQLLVSYSFLLEENWKLEDGPNITHGHL